jgi:hypothetical protein
MFVLFEIHDRLMREDGLSTVVSSYRRAYGPLDVVQLEHDALNATRGLKPACVATRTEDGRWLTVQDERLWDGVLILSPEKGLGPETLEKFS